MSNRFRRWVERTTDVTPWPEVAGKITEPPELLKLAGGGTIVRMGLDVGAGSGRDRVDLIVEAPGTEWLVDLLRVGAQVWATGVPAVAYVGSGTELKARRQFAATCIRLAPGENMNLQPPASLPAATIVHPAKSNARAPRLPTRGNDAARLLLRLAEHGEARAADLEFNYARLLDATIDLRWLGWPIVEVAVDPPAVAFDGGEHARWRVELARKVLRSREFAELRAVMTRAQRAAR